MWSILPHGQGNKMGNFKENEMPQCKKYTYQEYLTWTDEKRWELLDGIVYCMSPAPNIQHQQVVQRVFWHVANFLRRHHCVPVIAPTDVVLSEDTVLQPDVFIVCDTKKITQQNIQGAPDVVFEVLSPATAHKDKSHKKKIYERFGVKEYILLHPESRYVERFFLGQDGTFSKEEILGPDESLTLHTIAGLEIPLWEVFGVEKDRQLKSQNPELGI
jgi:Uma2 family endonuclease